MTEEWRPIEGFPNYQVSNLGRVKSDDRILKQSLSKNGGYASVCLYNGKRCVMKVHRLVAVAFLENPHNLETVDHIDRNRTNNLVSNLRWANRSTQALNRNKRTMVIYQTNTGHHHISYSSRRNGFIVQKRDMGVGCKQFKTLEEAIAFRDSLLQT